MLRIFILIIPMLMTIAHATACVDWPADVFSPIENTHTHQIAPDYGFYWFKMQDGKQEVAKAYLPPNVEPQFSNGQLNQLPAHETVAEAKTHRMAWLEQKGFFDPHKPTMIFIHGVQTNMTAAKLRFDFCYQFPGKDQTLSPLYDTLAYWKDWNVAVFYWNQFADVKKRTFLDLEAIVDPETYIYNSEGRDGIGWVYLNNKKELATCRNSDKHCMPIPKNPQGKVYNLSELAFAAYQNAMPEDYHQPLWISGFSLGNQIAIMLTKQIAEHPHLLQPQQLILLDPYYTPSFLKIDIGDRKVAIAPYDKEQVDKILATNHRLALSLYRSSLVSSSIYGDLNIPLQQEAAYLRVCPLYLNHLDGDEAKKFQHLTALYYYFDSKHYPLHYDDSSKQGFEKSYPGANYEVDDVRKFMGQARECNWNDFSKECELVVSSQEQCR